ncbi:hypothetical protein AURDEDRAFT_65688 [Auricularia subglabra TFB-10046 SS5]|nr:hypothetical protein AURDEDRAFT_65688 [Auricularia subglabra TFB-10046 SS5]
MLCLRRSLATQAKASLQHPFFLSRNSRGSLPVYSDFKNNGTKYLVEIRNVEGDADALATQLKDSLFADAERKRRLKVQVIRSRHVRLSGLAAHYKNDVQQWLLSRGF